MLSKNLMGTFAPKARVWGFRFFTRVETWQWVSWKHISYELRRIFFAWVHNINSTYLPKEKARNSYEKYFSFNDSIKKKIENVINFNVFHKNVLKGPACIFVPFVRTRLRLIVGEWRKSIFLPYFKGNFTCLQMHSWIVLRTDLRLSNWQIQIGSPNISKQLCSEL